MNMPHLPREDRYWKREDNEVIVDAAAVVIAIVLGAIIIFVVKFWRG